MYLNHTMCIWIWTQFNQPYGHVEDRMLRFFFVHIFGRIPITVQRSTVQYRAAHYHTVPCSSVPWRVVLYRAVQ